LTWGRVGFPTPQNWYPVPGCSNGRVKLLFQLSLLRGNQSWAQGILKMAVMEPSPLWEHPVLALQTYYCPGCLEVKLWQRQWSKRRVSNADGWIGAAG